jgi:hypothetical protein
MEIIARVDNPGMCMCVVSDRGVDVVARELRQEWGNCSDEPAKRLANINARLAEFSRMEMVVAWVTLIPGVVTVKVVTSRKEIHAIASGVLNVKSAIVVSTAFTLGGGGDTRVALPEGRYRIRVTAEWNGADTLDASCFHVFCEGL